MLATTSSVIGWIGQDDPTNGLGRVLAIEYAGGRRGRHLLGRTAMQDTERRTDHAFARQISNALHARPRNEPIGPTEHGLPDESSEPVKITPEGEVRIADKLLRK